MDEREIGYEEVGNYTKYALVEMLINKHKKSFNNLNQIEKLKSEISIIEENQKELDYYDKTGEIICSYYKLRDEKKNEFLKFYNF